MLLRLDADTAATAPLPEAPTILIRTDREQLTLRRMAQPDWASATGRDPYGLWTEIAVEPSRGEPVIQRLRWIPPGRFSMGSPDDEPGRWEAEGPQHQVVLGTGYWLFDTPCTQALWEAVMGENPSRFKSLERPVDRVSWEDVQDFMQRLNARIPGLDLVLPSEAQWEYACRAGSETSLYTGPIEIIGDMNAPALDPIAWYGGNSGVDFDLPEGEDATTGWWKDKDKQYPHTRAGTRKVKGKEPNPWGLYDMLGNVWEWTQDPWHDSYEGAPVDGSSWESDGNGAVRVIRGGSWFGYARDCRCAYRDGRRPDIRDSVLGFRCARAQGREPGMQEEVAPAPKGTLDRMGSWLRRLVRNDD